MRASWIALLLSTGCGTAVQTGGDVAAQDAAAPTDAAADTQEAGPSGLIVHEFGTFTSVQTSTGKALAGMQHAEEQIPAFVHRRDFGPTGSAGKEGLPEGVTQKLQTGAMYFHTAEPLAVQVNLKLPAGVFASSFPAPVVYGPAPAALKQLAGGEMAWTLQLSPGAALGTAPADTLWQDLRSVTQAATVQDAAALESERFLFYQGLARFTPPVLATSEIVNEYPKNRTTVQNTSDETIPAAFYVHIHAGGGQIKALGPLAAKGSVVVTPTPKETNANVYSAEATALLLAALTEAGLQPSEAKALLASWSHNYFKTFGLRVLYIAPAKWVDAWLPVSVAPQPDQHVRTFVGRVEILLPEEEAATLAAIQVAAPQNDLGVLDGLGFFAEAKVLRTLELTQDGAVQAFCQKLLHIAGQTK